MKKTLHFLFICLVGSSFAQQSLFSPSSLISIAGSVNSPSNETVANIIDGTTNTKYLDFDTADGMGFVVQLASSSASSGFDVSLANDSNGRDPMNVLIEGSLNGSTYTSVYSGALACNGARFSTASYAYPTSASYTYYRVTFSNKCNSSENCIQLSEFQLYAPALATASFSTVASGLYPNPVTSVLKLSLQDQVVLRSSVLVDVNGLVVKKNSLSDLTIDCSDLAAGFYFLQLETVSGATETLKIVKI